MPPTEDNQLGSYLRDRRAKLDPAALGFPLSRRRTPGLRREEVAQRAHVSATWYTWLEQGRGGSPSIEVLERISRALMLTDLEHEHLFLIALGHPPEVRYQAEAGISPRLQRVLDSLSHSPAFAKTATWDLVGWNAAAAALLGFDQLPPAHRNLLRRMFLDPAARATQANWTEVARYAVGAFRADAARAGASERMKALVDELSHASPEFAALWRDYDMHAPGDNTKQLRHPLVGTLTVEYSGFAVDGRPDLTLVVFNPSTPDDVKKIQVLLKVQAKRAQSDSDQGVNPGRRANRPVHRAV